MARDRTREFIEDYLDRCGHTFLLEVKITSYRYAHICFGRRSVSVMGRSLKDWPY